MIVKAEANYSRQTPTRLRLVAKAVKPLSVEMAMAQLEFMPKKAAGIVLQVLKQAVGNAVNNFGLSKESLTIKDIWVGEGPRFKRFRAVSRGRAHSIIKRSAHVRVELESKEQRVESVKASSQTVKPVEAKSEEVKEQSVAVPAKAKAAAKKPAVKKATKAVKQDKE